MFAIRLFLITILFYSYSNEYVYVTSHGIAATGGVYRLWAPYYYIGLKKIINQFSTIFYPIVSLNYRDSFRNSAVQGRFANSWGDRIISRIRAPLARLMRGWHFYSDVGQINDITQLSQAIRKYCQNGKKAIIQGVSRGGSVIFPMLALNQDLPVAAVISESPYASIDDVLRGVINNLGGWSLLEKYKYQLFCLIFRNHIPGLYQPIDSVDKVSKEIPILIICSLSDHLVPSGSSIKLYNALIQSGHSKTHLVILSQGRHGFLLQGPDKRLYENAVHNFYKFYDLPYDPQKVSLD